MRFQVLSHAGLSVTGGGVNLLFDPWLIGSAYWRSWWNYPPVATHLVASLRPDFICLTHIHWDHFHGVTLRKFDRGTPVIIPYGSCTRMKDDLQGIGFRNIIELRHGKAVQLSPAFRLTVYHVLALDSTVVVESEGITLLNANDCKLMGWPLQQVLDRHPRIDFAFRSHSAANARLCYETIGEPLQHHDQPRHYLSDFARFACATKARYAIPFASNHCFLHDEAFRYNENITTPQTVDSYFRQHSIDTPELRIMVSGDSWSSTDGFSIAGGDWFERRDEHLAEYRAAMQPKLAEQAALERSVRVEAQDLEKYFTRFCKALPAPLRRWFRGFPIAWIVSSGDIRNAFEVDIAGGGRTRVLDTVTDECQPIQVYTAAFILDRCLASSLFSHLTVSKRVRFRTTRAGERQMNMLNMLLSLYEFDILPLRSVVRPRSVRAWLPRWREAVMYAQLLLELLVTRKVDLAHYLPTERRFEEDARPLSDIMPG